jgi:hypothetical protein
MQLLQGILGPAKRISMQAYAVQGRLIGLPRLGVCSKFMIVTIKKINNTSHSLNIFKLTFRCFRGEGSFSR